MRLLIVLALLISSCKPYYTCVVISKVESFDISIRCQDINDTDHYITPYMDWVVFDRFYVGDTVRIKKRDLNIIWEE